MSIAVDSNQPAAQDRALTGHSAAHDRIERSSRIRGIFPVLLRASVVTAVVLRFAVAAPFRYALARLAGVSGDPHPIGSSLAKAFESLGGGVLKIGQILSTRLDILPEEVTAPLQRLQCSVAPFSAERALSIVERALAQPGDVLFLSFDPIPIGSASIAQVHRAVLRDSGREVAVKVRRPSIDRLVCIDAGVFMAVLKLVSRLPYFRDIPLLESGSEIMRAIEEQTDLRIEARRHIQFWTLFANQTDVRVPRLLTEYCTEDVLVMEYFPRLLKITAPEMDVGLHRTSVTTGLRALYKMLFLAGLVHCDLHPGNILVDVPAGGLVLIDFGFSTTMSESTRLAFARFFISIALNDGKTAAKLILETALRVPTELDREAFAGEISGLVRRASGAVARDFLVASFVKSLFAIQRKHKIYGSPDFTMAILSLMVYEGIIRYRCSDLDFQREAVPIVILSVRKTVQPQA